MGRHMCPRAMGMEREDEPEDAARDDTFAELEEMTAQPTEVRT